MNLKNNFALFAICSLILIIGVYSFCQAIHSTCNFETINSKIETNFNCDNELKQMYYDLLRKDSLKTIEIYRLNDEIIKNDSIYHLNINVLKTQINAYEKRFMNLEKSK